MSGHMVLPVDQETDTSPEATKQYLSEHVPSLLIKYIQVRTRQEKGGLDTLFDGEAKGSRRFVLEETEDDTDSTKALAQQLKAILSDKVIQADLEATLENWTPKLEITDVNAITIKMQVCYFSSVSRSPAWQAFIKDTNTSKQVLDQIAKAFCYWVVKSCPLTISSDQDERKLLVRKIHCLGKILHQSFVALTLEEEKLFGDLLFNDLERVLTDMLDEKNEQDIPFKTSRPKFNASAQTCLKKAIEESWVTEQRKIDLAIEAIERLVIACDTEQFSKKFERLFAKHKSDITDDFNQLKDFVQSLKANEATRRASASSSASSRRTGTSTGTSTSSVPNPSSPRPRPASTTISASLLPMFASPQSPRPQGAVPQRPRGASQPPTVDPISMQAAAAQEFAERLRKGSK